MTMLPKAFPLAVAGLCLAARAAVGVPGDPFEGATTGCIPFTKDHQKCEQKGNGLLSTLRSAITTCHVKQADGAFKGSPQDEEACEAKAFGKFDSKFPGLVGCPQPATDGMAALRDLLASEATTPPGLGPVYCDATSGALIDPTGDDAGFVPASKDALKCADQAGKSLGKLATLRSKCHAKAAQKGLAGKPFDEAACEATARAKYDASAQKFIDKGICPPCLDQTGQFALADAATDVDDQANGLVFVCPTQREAFFFHQSASPVPVPGGTATLVLDQNSPAAGPPVSDTRPLARDATEVFGPFTGTALGADTTLPDSIAVTLAIGSNQNMRGCADLVVELMRVDGTGALTPLATVTGEDVPQIVGGLVPRIQLNGTLPGATTIAAGESIAATMSLTNGCSTNHGVTFSYDGDGALSRIDFFSFE